MANNDMLPGRMDEALQLQHDIDILLDEVAFDIQFDDNDNILQQLPVIGIEPQQNEDLNTSFDSGVFSNNDNTLQQQPVIGIEPQQNLHTSFDSGLCSDSEEGEEFEDLEDVLLDLLDHAMNIDWD